MLNIYTLHYFYVTAQHLNFSRAAKRLYITQPALSKQIQQLEGQLQVKLFDRTKRSVKLTEAGMVLLDHCRKIFQAINELETSMEQFRKEIRGALRIAATPGIGHYIMPDFLKEFTTVYPQILIHTNFKNGEEIHAMLRMQEIDFGLIDSDEDFDELERIPLAQQRMVFICGRNCEHHCDHLRSSIIPVRALGCCKFISFDKTTETRKMVDRVAKENNIKIDSVIESENIEVVKSMVVRGLGGSIVPEYTVRREMEEKLLSVKEVEGAQLDRPISLYYKRDIFLTRAHEEFLSLFSSFYNGDELPEPKNGPKRSRTPVKPKNDKEPKPRLPKEQLV